MSQDTRLVIISLIVIWALLYGMRLMMPDDILNRDQERPCAYILDAVVNGEWLCQGDHKRDVTSKPPLYTWLGAGAVLLFGPNRFSVTLPAALSTLGAALLVFLLGARFMSARAGALGAVCYLLSIVGVKQIALIRTDGLLTFLVSLTAFFAFLSWNSKSGWWRAWFFGTLATLTKGPVGIVLGMGALVSAFFERQRPFPWMTRRFWAPITLFLVLVCGWFWLSWLDWGQVLIDKFLYKEVGDHMLHNTHGQGVGSSAYKPLFYLIARFLPWSITALVGVWRVFRASSENELERRLERFLLAWIVVGLVVFALPAHKRADHIFPMVPAFALLAGREMARWSASLVRKKYLSVVSAVCVFMFVALSVYYGVSRSNKDDVKNAPSMRAFSETIKQKVGAEFPLSFSKADYALQFYLGTMREMALDYEVLRAFRGDAAFFVVTGDAKKLQALAGGSEKGVEIVLCEENGLGIVGNRKELAREEHMLVFDGRITIRTEGAELLRFKGREFGLRVIGDTGRVIFVNKGLRSRTYTLHMPLGEGVENLTSSPRSILEAKWSKEHWNVNEQPL